MNITKPETWKVVLTVCFALQNFGNQLSYCIVGLKRFKPKYCPGS